MIENQVRIRQAILSDCQRILELLSDLGRPSPQDSNEKKKFKNLIKNYIGSKEDRSILLACTDSEIIGLISYVLVDRLNQYSREFWIPEFIVSNEYRCQGTGKLLIQKCESIARRKKCFGMRLESGNDRIDSHEFYKKIGFKQTALTLEMHAMLIFKYRFFSFSTHIASDINPYR